MSAPESASEIRRWLRYASEDLRTAEILMSQPGIPPRNACFYAQQAAEKALKAVLIFLGRTVPRIHDLDALRETLPDDWSVTREHPDLASLTNWAAHARYPSDEPGPLADDAIEAIAQDHAVLTSVTRDLRQHGLTE